MTLYEKRTVMPLSAKDLFAWHERDGAFERLTPPWEHLKLEHKDPSLQVGSETHFKIQKGCFSISWIARHTQYVPNKEFVDIQVKGPFKKWVHHHKMIPIDKHTSEMYDLLNFETPLGLGKKIAFSKVKQMFQYRHTLLKNDLEVQQQFKAAPMTVAVTGASGMIGTSLCAFLKTAGHKVVPISRSSQLPNGIQWDPESGSINQSKLEGLDVLINLAGDNISKGRWTQKKKKRIRDSRVKSTRLIVNALNNLKNPPKVFISISGVGYYGTNPESISTEQTSPGNDFLASVCAEWEQAANQFKRGRCVIPRLGVVLSSSGGALAKISQFFKLGLGGVIGKGDQKMSWIALDDAIYSLYRMMIDSSLIGPINLCSPNSTTNYNFTKSLAKVLKRPAVLSLPSVFARLAFGQVADATILSNSQARPKVLEKSNHRFYYPELDSALKHTLGRY